MTFSFALLLVLLVGLVILGLVWVADWQQAHQPVSAGFGPANHRSTVVIGV